LDGNEYFCNQLRKILICTVCTKRKPTRVHGSTSKKKMPKQTRMVKKRPRISMFKHQTILSMIAVQSRQTTTQISVILKMEGQASQALRFQI